MGTVRITLKLSAGQQIRHKQRVRFHPALISTGRAQRGARGGGVRARGCRRHPHGMVHPRGQGQELGDVRDARVNSTGWARVQRCTGRSVR